MDFTSDTNNLEEVENKMCGKLVQQFYSDSANEEFDHNLEDEKDFDDDFCDNDSFDEPLVILKKKQQGQQRKRRKTQDFKCSKSEDESSNFDLAEDYQLVNPLP